jgi:hypothetical protein
LLNRIAFAVVASLVLALVVAAQAGAGQAVGQAGQVYFYASVSATVGDPATPSAPVVRPPVIYLTYDGAIVVKSLHWSSWGKAVAHAAGVDSASNCNPSCATGQLTNHPARVTLTSPGLILGHDVYRCYQLTVPALGVNQRSCLKAQGTSFVYAPVSKGTSNSALKLARFYTPSKNIQCEMDDNGGAQSSVTCGMQKPPAIARLAVSGHVSICQHQGLKCTGNWGQGPAARLLRYGSSLVVGRFRCTSAFSGVTCVVIKSSRGFFLSKQSIRRV